MEGSEGIRRTFRRTLVQGTVQGMVEGMVQGTLRRCFGGLQEDLGDAPAGSVALRGASASYPRAGGQQGSSVPPRPVLIQTRLLRMQGVDVNGNIQNGQGSVVW